ncbi:M48 family metallopeptidase [Corynebacterium tapiri]|uniref:M48 family metallopeptidase n=1 Tax=Corynebacterium tapiri TaxID=1448266 RepID=A0A5C4U3Z2_9CORY|nr:M48 family metallopeptidase [Corynebacterium tapiri]TNL98392.1 M48 family metallopeptidase [Corynebacterium tapiri]
MTPSSVPSEVTIVRSTRRKKTVQARRTPQGIEVRVPAGMSPRAEKKAVDSLVAKLQRRRAPRSDAQLLTRAHELNQRYLDSQARIGSVRWVDNQHTRWGSCTTSTGDIRLSSRLQGAPEYVVDAVLIHELVHTFVPNHSREFWQWADRAPKAERAKGYLEALSQLG